MISFLKNKLSTFIMRPFIKKNKIELTVKVFLNNKLITTFFQFLSIGNVSHIYFQ